MSEYITLLQSHDWYYSYSDDYNAWVKGRQAKDRLISLKTEIDPLGLVWDQYAPSQFKLTPKG
jgi:hypothetical protein